MAAFKITPSSGNVFADLGFDEEEAERLRIRSSLMIAIRRLIESRRLTQADAAKHFGVTQPRISDLVRGKIDLFSIDTLVAMLARGGIHVDVVLTETPRNVRIVQKGRLRIAMPVEEGPLLEEATVDSVLRKFRERQDLVEAG